MLPEGIASHPGGEILFNGQDLLKLPETALRSIRGAQIAMIFQEPMTSLNPVYTVGEQIAEGLVLHEGLSKKDALNLSLILLLMCIKHRC